jgi:hypothetical protein
MTTAAKETNERGGVKHLGAAEPKTNPIAAAREAIVHFLNKLNWEHKNEWQKFSLLPWAEDEQPWNWGMKQALRDRLRYYYMRNGNHRVEVVFQFESADNSSVIDHDAVFVRVHN